MAGYGFPSARVSLHALSCLAFLFLFLSTFASAASFRLFIFSAWRRLIRRCSGTGGFEMPLLNPCKAHTRWSQDRGATQHTADSKSKLTREMYPGSGRILILQRSSGSLGKSATAYFALRAAVVRESSLFDVLEPSTWLPGVSWKIGRALSMRGITLCRWKFAMTAAAVVTPGL